MSTERSTTFPPHSDASALRHDDLSSIHMVGMSMALRDVAQRLSSVEEKLDSREAGSGKGTRFLEFLKVVFGGWPAFGFLFILLFYSPLKQALNAIPEKVKTADEIGVLGVSLKSTIRVEAAKLGEVKLSETIPALSSAAIELLLRAPRNSDSLISYTPNDERQYVGIHFPSPPVVAALSELQAQGLVELETWDDQEPSRKITGAGVTELIEKFRNQNPGTEQSSFSEGRTSWVPNTPLPKGARIPVLTWQLTEFGQKGVAVILKAVSTELAPKSQPATSPRSDR